MPFKERQRLRHPGPTPQACAAPSHGVHSQTTLAMPHSPQSSSELCRAARTAVSVLRSSLKNPKPWTAEQGSCSGCSSHPHKIPPVPSITSVSPQQSAGTASSWQQAEGRRMLFHKAFTRTLLTHPTNSPGLCSTNRKSFAGPAGNLLLSFPPREQGGKGMCCWGVTAGWS